MRERGSRGEGGCKKEAGLTGKKVNMIKTDEWTERQTSAQRQLLRAQVRRAALEEYYERLVRSRAESNGVDAVELLLSGEAAEEMSALEDELDDARHDLDLADARSKLLAELLEKKPEGRAPADDEDGASEEETEQ
jgi:hypothetical protein